MSTVVIIEGVINEFQERVLTPGDTPCFLEIPQWGKYSKEGLFTPF